MEDPFKIIKVWNRDAGNKLMETDLILPRNIFDELLDDVLREGYNVVVKKVMSGMVVFRITKPEGE
jgi:hypothetical protein